MGGGEQDTESRPWTFCKQGSVFAVASLRFAGLTYLAIVVEAYRPRGVICIIKNPLR